MNNIYNWSSKRYTILLIIIIIILLLFISYNIFMILTDRNDRDSDRDNNNNIIYNKLYGSYPIILNLVLYNDSDYYRGMYENTREYYNKHKNVDTIYYMYSEKETNEYRYDIENNMLYIKGKETYVPGILHKTIKAFKFVPLLGKKYDYIIRTNISTLVDFRKLSEELMRTPISYGTGRFHRIGKGHRDYKGGIYDDRYNGLTYPNGTCIIFSDKLYNKIMDKIHLIDDSIIDDVSIGYFMKTYFPEYKGIEYLKFFYDGTDKDIDPKNININKYIFFRNKNTKDRYRDIESIKKLINSL